MIGKSKFCFFSLLLFLIAAQNFCQAQSIRGLPKAQKRIQIPFQYLNNFIVVKVNVNGLPLKFILDSGAAQTVITKRVLTKHLEVDYSNKVTFYGSDLLTELYAYPIKNTDLTIGNLTFAQQISYVLEEDYLALETMVGLPVHGIMSMHHFDKLVLKVDYKKMVLTVSEPERIDYDKGETLPFALEGNRPYIFSTIELQNKDSVYTKLLIDTGANIGLLLHNETHPKLTLPNHFVEGKLADGLGGHLLGYVGRINKISFGKQYHLALICNFQKLPQVKNKAVFKARNGLIGNKLLHQYDVVFDFYYNELKLLNRNLKRQDKYDRSGLVYYATGKQLNTFLIENVIKNSSADLAGIEKGDEIIKVNYSRGAFLNLNAINNNLQKKAGKKIKMLIKRNGKKLRKHFILKDLI